MTNETPNYHYNARTLWKEKNFQTRPQAEQWLTAEAAANGETWAGRYGIHTIYRRDIPLEVAEDTPAGNLVRNAEHLLISRDVMRAAADILPAEKWNLYAQKYETLDSGEEWINSGGYFFAFTATRKIAGRTETLWFATPAAAADCLLEAAAQPPDCSAEEPTENTSELGYHALGVYLNWGQPFVTKRGCHGILSVDTSGRQWWKRYNDINGARLDGMLS